MPWARRPGRRRHSRTAHPTDINVGTRIRARREELCFTQDQLAHFIGVTAQQVQNYERSASRVSASMLKAIAEALNVPVSYFFDGGNEPLATELRFRLRSEETREFIRAYSILPPIVRHNLLAFMRAAAQHLGPKQNRQGK